jgi:hypothetical protein
MSTHKIDPCLSKNGIASGVTADTRPANLPNDAKPNTRSRTRSSSQITSHTTKRTPPGNDTRKPLSSGSTTPRAPSITTKRPTSENRMPDVEHLGGLSFHIRSRSRPMVHQVELAEFNGWGACACEQFEFRARPLLVKPIADPERKEPGEWQQCPHIERAIKWLGTHAALLTLDEMRRRAIENANRSKS